MDTWSLARNLFSWVASVTTVKMVSIELIVAWLGEASKPQAMTPAAMRRMCGLGKRAIEALQKDPKTFAIRLDDDIVVKVDGESF